jgi:hypothetical protein
MKHSLLIIFLTFGIKVFGTTTPQIPDKLIYQGVNYEWSGFSPAYKYFEKHNLKPPKEALETTANYGVFIYTYSIIDNKLYLTDVEILIEKKVKYGENYATELADKSVFKDFFPNSDRILMAEHSNIQIIPNGEVIEVTKNDWTDIHNEKYLIFDFKNGIILNKYDLNYKKYKKLKKKQFKKFKKTEFYKKELIDKKKDLEYFNEFRPDKYSMDKYLKLIIFRIIKHLK